MIEVNKDTFQNEVIESEKPVIVDFWGPSCVPCLNLMPDIESLSAAYEEKVKIVKINSSQNRRLCIDLRVMGLPAFLVYKNGEEVKRVSGGDLTKQDIENIILEIA
ncbi:thioredoxin family protein [Anaerobacillus sp. MEB173]|uniref:thioredoxin family protein n=1 Tax=Anaerobacillus sp. MEB173 TaxID=3383345 RepID=UPI003F93CEC5